MKNQKGFTLNELIFAIIMLFIIAGYCFNAYLLITEPLVNEIKTWIRVGIAAFPFLLLLRR